MDTLRALAVSAIPQRAWIFGQLFMQNAIEAMPVPAFVLPIRLQAKQFQRFRIWWVCRGSNCGPPSLLLCCSRPSPSINPVAIRNKIADAQLQQAERKSEKAADDEV